MNTQKRFPLLPSTLFLAAVLCYACGTSKSPSGTPGSPRDTTGVQTTKTLSGGTPGSPRDTTSMTIKKN